MKKSDISTLVLKDMEREGLSCSRLAEKMGVHRATVGRLLKNESTWTLDYISRAGAVFNRDYFLALSHTHDTIVRQKDKEIDTLIQEKIDIIKKLDESERENRELRDELKVEKRVNERMAELGKAG